MERNASNSCPGYMIFSIVAPSGQRGPSHAKSDGRYRGLATPSDYSPLQDLQVLYRLFIQAFLSFLTTFPSSYYRQSTTEG